MTLEILRYELARGWRGMLGWMLALSAVATLYLSLYGSIAETLNTSSPLMQSLPPSLMKSLSFDAITSGAGYAQSTLYGLLGFVLLTVASIVWGTAAVAGAEESGSLELTLSHSISRSSYYAQALLTLMVRTGLLAATAGTMTFLWNGPGKLAIDTGNIIPMCISYWLIGLTAGCTALGVGAVFGAKKVAIAAGAGLAVLSYMMNALGRQNPNWEWMLNISPYHWAYGSSPLANGWDGANLLGLALLSAVFVLLGWAVFNRRDIV